MTTEVQPIDKFLPLMIFDLYYSMPGEGKSEAIKAVAKQALKENPGKRIKLVIGDGSGATYSSLIRAGKADLIETIHRPWPLDTLNKLTSGYNLKDKNDPTSPLVKPTADDLNSYCLSVFEGFSVFGKYIMGSVEGGMAQRAASGEQMGPDAIVSIFEGKRDAKGNLSEGPGTSFGTNGTAHYMAAQGHLVEFANRSRALPGHKIWTAHETIMDDVVNIGDLKNPVKIRKGVVIGGPEAAGKALTPNLQRIFNNTLHFQTVAKQVKGDKDENLDNKELIDNEISFFLWTRDHHAQNGATNVKFKGCTRNVPEDFPPYFIGEKKGQNILDYYRALHEIEKKEMAELE